MATLADIVSSNFNRIRLEHDLSTRELAARANMPQKTVYSLCHQTHTPKIDTVEALCKTLFVQPQAIVTESLPVNMLMSRRIGKLIEGYKVLTPEQRDQVMDLIESF
jgi:DNA-binding Xre family transcriptional regulator